MMGNIERITRHLREKLSHIPGSDPEKETLTLIYTKKGKSWLLDGDGSYWRAYKYIEPHQTFDLADDPVKVKEAGRAYGRFMYLLSDLGGEPLHDTIPNFHNIEMRLLKFHEALVHGNKPRIKEAPDEIKLILDQAEEMTLLSRLGKEGKIPIRITHNDTKINNILFSPEGKAMCVIDLDTVMPGFVHFDFGDAIRTFTNTAAEDESDLSKVSMNIEFFENFATGYLSATSLMLTAEEKKHLAFSAKYFTYLHVLRFLTDYIEGDIYYKIHYPQHNLVRARNQFTLLKSMESNYSTMQKIISKLS
jgi:Ser/Thr protein kinase RdoA (MazF antagonist)